ncbi:hypothetical protein [Streptomyces sp. NPDC007088]|uniref:hypothetical protein n=1 Tax=Streptomyces sp. NPDC007088 TaxID=3364773 RepID=UPI0036A7AAAF
MSTALIVVLVVVVVALAVGALVFAKRGKEGGGSLRRRFGPEYERTVAHHNGDVKAAEQELAERVRRHGSLRERPLDPAAREQYLARWAGVQERFVEAPRQAVAEAEHLVDEVAGARGFPEGSGHAERVEALSVHHPHHVHGYRRLHDSAAAGSTTPGPRGSEYAAGAEEAGAAGHASTEDLREAMVEARGLFEELVGAGVSNGAGTGHHHGRTAAGDGRHDGALPGTTTGVPPAAGPASQAPAPGQEPVTPAPAAETAPFHSRDLKGK